MPSVIRHQNAPTPQCGHVNAYTGVALAKAEAATEQAAHDAARDEATTRAQQLLTTSRALACPGGPDCLPDGDWQDDVQLTTEVVLVQQDAGNNRWIAYATAKWRTRRSCRGDTPGENWTLDPAHVEQRYNTGGDPQCNKTRVYSGCVIAYAGEKFEWKANRAAKKAALDRARALLVEDLGRECPYGETGGCFDGQTSSSTLTARRLLAGRVPQAADGGHKFIAHALAHWTVTITCPARVAMGEDRRRTEGELV